MSITPKFMINMTKVIRKSALNLMFAACIFSQVCANNYYVKIGGNDSNDGLSKASAWATIGKVNNTSFLAGDHVCFEGGSTFAGTLQIGNDDNGTVDNPIIITSYGTVRAIINGTVGNGINLKNCKYVQIRNINIKGNGYKTGNSAGRGIFPNGTTSCIIDSVEVVGFQRAGVEFQGCTDLRLTNIYAHDNGYAGISSGPESAAISTNVYIGNCRAIHNPGDPTVNNNHSGSGIVLYNCNKGIIEFCEAADNGAENHSSLLNGPVGIWCAYSSNLLFQYNISHNNKDYIGGDGGGFDFDGGTTNTIMQYNYAYENNHYGFQFCTWANGPKVENNICRYNISVNNVGQELTIYEPGRITNQQVYNNVFFNQSSQVCNGRGAGSEFKFYNNIFLKAGTADNFFVSFNNSVITQGNTYFDYDGGTSYFNDGVADFKTWLTKGHEKLNGATVGQNIDPRLFSPLNYPKLTDPNQLVALYAFMLQEVSPCIDKGLDIKSLLRINYDIKDFYGNATPYNALFDIGAHEFTPNADIKVTGINVAPKSVELSASKSVLLVVSFTPSNATNRVLNWASNDTSVATVSDGGLVTGKRPGTAIITVSADNGNYTATSSVTVVTDNCSHELTAGGIALDNNAVNPTNGNEINAFDDSQFACWTVNSKTGIIEYDFGANVAKAVNQYVVSSNNDVTYNNSPKSWDFQAWNNVSWVTLESRNNISFLNNHVQSFNFNNSTPYSKYRLNITENNGGNNLTLNEIQMMYCNENVVFVSEVTITSPRTVNLQVGDKFQPFFAVKPDNASIKTVVWTSKDSTIAKVDKYSGEVTGVAPGQTNISVITDDGSHVEKFIVIVELETNIDGLYSDNGFLSYPNPVTNTLTIYQNDRFNSCSINLFNGMGELINSQIISENPFKIDMSNYPGGIYILRVKSSEGRTSSIKIIKI
jgi:uncharacterized protein YjdB